MQVNTHEVIMQELGPLINDLKPLVKGLESGMELTKNHYGSYMSILGREQDRKRRLILAYCLQQAGANMEGVRSALRVLGDI